MAVVPGKDHREDIRIGERLIRDVARRAAEMQQLPQGAYDGLPAATRESFERGALYVMAALESLGWALLPPRLDGSPVIPIAAGVIIPPNGTQPGSK